MARRNLKSVSVSRTTPSQPKSVHIETVKASNGGFAINTHDQDFRRKTFIAKTVKEKNAIVKKLTSNL